MSNEQTQSGCLTFILGAYGVSILIFGVYFNWLYAKQHGFISWLLFGEVVATFKAIIWPIFIFF